MSEAGEIRLFFHLYYLNVYRISSLLLVLAFHLTQPMHKIYLASVLLILPVIRIQAQHSVTLSGKVSDAELREPLPGVNLSIKGTIAGTITNTEGIFSLNLKSPLPITLVASFIGYTSVEIVVANETFLNIFLQPGTLLAEEVVITASRKEESELKSPVAIEKLDLRAIKESPAPGFYDALENVKGVQMTTSSLTFKVPNTRGFNIPNNFRFVQLVDGVDMQAATLGVPLGNAIGPTELDIESVEITPGAASALYGMNAINGMANLITKSPFVYQGLSVYQKTGINHIDGIDYNPSVLSESAFRFAKAFKNKLALKINASYMQGTDWRGNSSNDQNPNSTPGTGNPSYSELDVIDHPAYDAWNKYGDDNGSNAVTITGLSYKGKTNQSLIVRRTGYWEKDLVPPKVDNLKFDAALHYRIGEWAEISYAYRYGQMDGLFQRGNKIQLNNTTVPNHKIELKGADFLVRSYVSLENTGDSYNLKPLSDNLDLSHLSNNAWRDKYKTVLQTEINAGVDFVQANRDARAGADLGRVEPGTAEFDALKNTIIKINNWDHKNAGIPTGTETGGAWLHQMSRTYHTDAQWDLSKKVKVFDLLVGADLRIYEVIPDGNNFVDFSRPIAERSLPLDNGSFGKNVRYTKYGFFAQAIKTMLKEKIKIFGSLRVDQNLEFNAKVNPRFAIVYTLANQHNFRASIQNGYRFPALFEALSFVNNGNVRRVGGLSYINEGLGYLDNSYTLASINIFNAAVNKEVAAGKTNQAASLNNKNLLEITNLSTTQPERINSVEVGYKSVLFHNSLVVDLDAYVNQYKNFLGQVDVAVPGTGVVGTDASAIDMLSTNRAKQTRYRVYTNAKQKYTNYGSSIGISCNPFKKFTISGNLNYNSISRPQGKDVFVTGFNTPQWAANISFGNREIIKNFGFNMVMRWQDSFLWESPLANGVIPAYQTFDAQINYRFPGKKSILKIGGTNLFNNRYIQYAGGPAIGGLYYMSFTIDGLLIK
jgi:iron complex outermembrane receptor protein